ncbi:hypothetical protein WIV_gp014 [Wiseana iridescent virus]|uniref:Uncharacterized protein n=1 Tax=Wiseana iridescent virus TaxID=68347 RepID=G0T540_IRV9|nr:hypothetical protein WIV_gp014 [Wiseana iridescent virus]ADO00357.1 hypothetical protein [Wiseana iridescent virus]
MTGAISQPLAPVTANDLTNKAYVDGLLSAPGSIPGTSITNNSITNTQLAPGAAAANINAGPPGAINASQIAGGPFLPLAGGAMTGAISQPLAPIAVNDLTNKAYVDLQSQKAFAGFKHNNGAFQLSIPAGTTVRAFSGGFDLIGNTTWTGADGVNITMAPTGIITINSTRSTTSYYVCSFFGTGLTSSVLTNNASVYFRFYDETNLANINSQEQVLSSVSTSIIPMTAGHQFNNSAVVYAFVQVPANSSLNISVQARNPGTDSVFLDSVDDVCQVTIVRQG